MYTKSTSHTLKSSCFPVFNFIKDTLSTFYSSFSAKITGIFSQATIDEEAIKELEHLLIRADVGVPTTRSIIDAVRAVHKSGTSLSGAEVKKIVEQELARSLKTSPWQPSQVFLLVGINGSGKTTCAGKLAHLYAAQGKKVLLAAADTFRAAATAQLQTWATRTHADIVTGKEGQDPASVVFTACQQFKNNAADILIIDTAGRLQTKVNLMKELEKMRRIITAQLPNHPITTLLTVDALLGQNSFEQARLFNESTTLDGIILTKMDGTAKGGIIFSIMHELQVPVRIFLMAKRLEILNNLMQPLL